MTIHQTFGRLLPGELFAHVPHGFPKIATLDIETAPIVAHAWALFDQTIGLSQIVRDWAMLSYSVKALGRPQVFYHDTFDRKDKYDDRELADDLWEILHHADFIIAQNGVRFDLKKIRARLLIHGYNPPAPVKVLDTMLMARRVGGFTSNKLEWLTTTLTPEYAKSKHKQFPGHELWREYLNGNPQARDEMRKYNPQDVLGTEALYLKLRPWVSGHPNMAVFAGYDDTGGARYRCPVCGGDHVYQDGDAHTNTGVYMRLYCSDCGAWSRSRYTLNSLDKRKRLLTSTGA